MVNILFDCPNVDDFKDELKDYFTPDSRVAVVAFSFYDDYVYDNTSWQRVYGYRIGNGYFEVVDALSVFGVKEDNIVFINYFTDTKETAKNKINSAITQTPNSHQHTTENKRFCTTELSQKYALYP